MQDVLRRDGDEIDELLRIRAELDHLVAVRYAGEMSEYQRGRYDDLARRESHILSTITPVSWPAW